jgi:N-acetylated-alpha-linked acidic dipeptidase
LRRFGLVAFLVVVPWVAGAEESIRGFSPAALEEEHKWEEQARLMADPSAISGYMRHLSAKPHLAGTPNSHEVAEYALGLMKQWGLDAHIEEFDALLPTPTTRLLEMTAPKKFRAKLEEPPVPGDPTSYDKDEVPTYNAYSGSGDVTAPLVYANYGMPGDYEYLAKHSIDVKGKIVITRYGGGWRGLKPRLAAEHGALGCLIYSDPRDDGYWRGDVYPKGAWRNADGVQRGSVVDMTLYPGDPMTPGWASEPGAKRLALSEVRTLMKIPVLPISYGDALPLMRELEGQVPPEEWRGALGITYHVGNGSVKVRLKVEMDNGIHPLYDVIARIPGSQFGDEWVLAGNHHDAWVHGAMDPLSGASTLLETARTLGQLQRKGWHPKRTIMIALWDGEEFGLIGSTEYAEKHADELSRKVIAYINSDSTGKGRLGAGGSHTLEEFVAGIVKDVKDPVTGKPPDWRMEALGSGSDYTSFLQHLGIASLNLGFGDDEGSGGIYHSAYDSYYWYTHFSDTNFVYCKTLSTITVLALMRIADAALIPLQFTQLTGALEHYADEIAKLQAGGGVSLTGLRTAIGHLQRSAREYETSYAHALPRLDRRSEREQAALAQANERLLQFERHMLLEAGLPRRPWFKHAIYAPGSLTGYGVKTLPGIREAVEAGRPEEAAEQARLAEQVLQTLNVQIQAAIRSLNAL